MSTHIENSITSLKHSVADLENNLLSYEISIESTKRTLEFYTEKYRQCESSIAEVKNALKVLEILRDGNSKKK